MSIKELEKLAEEEKCIIKAFRYAIEKTVVEQSISIGDEERSTFNIYKEDNAWILDDDNSKGIKKYTSLFELCTEFLRDLGCYIVGLNPELKRRMSGKFLCELKTARFPAGTKVLIFKGAPSHYVVPVKGTITDSKLCKGYGIHEYDVQDDDGNKYICINIRTMNDDIPKEYVDSTILKTNADSYFMTIENYIHMINNKLIVLNERRKQNAQMGTIERDVIEQQYDSHIKTLEMLLGFAESYQREALGISEMK